MVNQEEIFQEILKEQRRYSDSTLIITLFSELLKRENLGEIIFIEKELKKLNDELKKKILKKTQAQVLQELKNDIKNLPKIEIDLILKNDKYEIVEFKTSVSHHPDEVDRTIGQIKERDTDLLEDLNVLETSNIIFLCHKDDSDRIIQKFNKDLKGKLKREVCFLEWIHGDNKDHDPCMYIEFNEGENSSSGLVNKIRNKKVSYPEISLAILRQRKKFIFTGKKPPKPYLFSSFKKFLLFHIHPILNKPDTPEECQIPEDLDNLKELFVKWHTNSYSKPKLKWFNESIEFFKKLKIVRVERNKLYVNIKNLTKKRRSYKDEDEYFSYLCAKEKIKEIVKKIKQKKKSEEKAKEKQKSLGILPLDSFFPNQKHSHQNTLASREARSKSKGTR